MRSPSSLIFVVLLGIWAAYFLQHWIRRRDHLATARSVDQFTAAMRVLERRDVAPRTDLSTPSPPSYAVHPHRSVRPQVLVKRAVPAESAVRQMVSAPVGVAPGVVQAEGRTPVPRTAARPDTAGVQAPRRGEPEPEAPRGGGPRPATRPAPSGRSAARVGIRPSRRVRGLFVLVAVVELLTIGPLVALSMAPAWVLAPSLLAVGWALAWLRSGVRAEQAAARSRRRRPTTGDRRVSAPSSAASDVAHRETVTSAAPVSAAAPAATTSSATGTTPAAMTSPVTATPAAQQAGRSVTGDEVRGGDRIDIDVAQESPSRAPAEVVVEAAPEVPVPLVDEDDIPLTWDPVPVPRPTYTMKAKAERRDPVPADVTPAGQPAERDGATAFADRRVAGA